MARQALLLIYVSLTSFPERAQQPQPLWGIVLLRKWPEDTPLPFLLFKVASLRLVIKSTCGQEVIVLNHFFESVHCSLRRVYYCHIPKLACDLIQV